MSVHPGSSRSACTPACRDPSHPFTLVYPISRTSIAGHTPDGDSAIIEVHIAINADSCGVRVIDPVSKDERSIAYTDTPPIAICDQDGWLHVDVPGIISCSIVDAGTESAALVYARTPVLGELGVPGGRFDPPSILWAR